MSDKKDIILVVEDDHGLQRQLKWSFSDLQVELAGNRDEAIAALRLHEPKVITLDLGLPPDPDGTSEGFALLEQILNLTPNAKVIVASGHQARDSALKAIAGGAWDFYQKPIDADELNLIVNRAFHVAHLEAENRRYQALESNSALGGLITASEPMLKVCRMIERVAPTDASIILLGASGTGKELLARALHDLSDRSNGPFVAINCAAIPENLLESELFGYEKGAFTGAVKQTLGKIELAQNGTLFLDEVGDIPLPLQVKLLRFLQERVVERIGGRKEIPVDVRIICATHQNLPTMIEDGSFREDLFYRLAEISVNIPPLKDREGDAVLLARSFLNRFSADMKRTIKGFTPDAVRAISGHDWPGNVRELENKIKRAAIMADGDYVAIDDLDLVTSDDTLTALNLKHVREEADKAALRQALSESANNISKTAKLLGVSRPTLYGLLKQYDMTPT